MAADPLKKLMGDNWPKRRRYMTVVLLWAMFNVDYILIFSQDNVLNQNALFAFITLIGSIIGTYVFGAVWDDSDKRKHLAGSTEDETK